MTNYEFAEKISSGLTDLAKYINYLEKKKYLPETEKEIMPGLRKLHKDLYQVYMNVKFGHDLPEGTVVA